MNSLKARLAAFQRTRVGLFIKKVLDDQTPNLAALLAWGTLSAMLPLILGVLALAGLVLRDQQRLDQVYGTVLAMVPAGASQPVSDALQSVRTSAGSAGIVALVLLLFNGSSFFANMGSVFDQAYHVQSRNFAVQRAIAVVMLIVTSVLLVVSTLAAGLGSVVSNLPTLGLPIGPALAVFISYSLSIISAFVLFLLLYKVLPNANQGWRDVIPGTLFATVLLLLISQIFPIYLRLFPPNHAYAIFGVFLVLTFWLYLLGFVFVLGAQLNAFMRDPSRSVALAEATNAAARGRADYEPESGKVRAEAEGSAPSLQGGGVLGMPQRSPREQQQQAAPAQAATQQADTNTPRKAEPAGASKPSFAGRVLGFIGLIVAALLLRGRTEPTDHHATA